MIYSDIKRFVLFATKNNLISKEDYDYAINKLCGILNLDTFIDSEVKEEDITDPSRYLNPLLDYAVKERIINVDTVLNRDVFEARLIDIVLPRPSEVNRIFSELYDKSKKQATDFYYDLSQKSNYIKTSRTSKNVTWKSNTKYGDVELTINLSKPEKDPRDIMAQGKTISTSYPKCLLCKEYVGLNKKPGRTNHRIIPLKLNGEDFYLQYSPYVYYNEHCIVLMKEHLPMNVTEKTFRRLFDFVDQFPHYFLGSNAGLPIVGGSILSHEHYQGGAYHFPIEDARELSTIEINNVKIKKLDWPISVVRLESEDLEAIIESSDKLYKYWEGYSNNEIGIFCKTNEPHNAITPIARKNGDLYVIDMALRNNRTSEEFPLGIFHTHPENYNIKKENIGLIEVSGLIVLPARLNTELPLIKDILKTKAVVPTELDVHRDWIDELKLKYNNENIDAFIEREVAIKFTKCLENAAVFKQDETSQNYFEEFIRGFANELSKKN